MSIEDGVIGRAFEQLVKASDGNPDVMDAIESAMGEPSTRLVESSEVI